ncbi:MAG: molybdopterin-dependent oxidoreductase [Thermogemmatispora sp.]|uniref:molybdopterin-dependent oxidoreductase n=1 Tax=Thermogemmatispora sp. TaxID=1968838 RepID=UPI001A045313|nr:molybdopterin-dependent oxidoreductase [Thermogemmatispora sp.]MBE3565685.1 molybdopterin-dependent oxidoreductase [Thermogemmatispora sp.]
MASPETSSPPRPSAQEAFVAGSGAGLLAGLASSGCMLLLNVFAHGVSLPEQVGAAITALMPLSLFQFLQQLMGDEAKRYLLVCVILGQCLVFAASGGLYMLARRRFLLKSDPGPRLGDGLVLAALLWFFAGLVVLPLTGAGLFGATLSIGWFNSMWSLAASGLVFALLFPLAYHWLTASRLHEEQHRAEVREQRQTLLRRGLILGGVGLLAAFAFRFITQGSHAPTVTLRGFKSRIVPPPQPNYGSIVPVPHLSSEITPNDQYYVVSKNLLADPVVNGQSWRLTIGGQVEQPYTLTYAELLTLPMRRQYESMMCISNEVGGPYMSNALWEGVPLNVLLQRARPKPGATKVVFSCADDYSDSIHLTKALEPTTVLAVRMNGQTLPERHGYPLRLLVPGIYGMKHAKWITRIEVVNYDYQGYWQQRGWSDEAQIRMTTRIDTPLDGSRLQANSLAYIAGVAFSGERGISEVDVSFDLGQSWRRATLKRPLSALTWVLWELPWRVPSQAGSYTITARAIDLQGNVQDPRPAPPLPDGASGYHTITVVVA